MQQDEELIKELNADKVKINNRVEAIRGYK